MLPQPPGAGPAPSGALCQLRLFSPRLIYLFGIRKGGRRGWGLSGSGGSACPLPASSAGRGMLRSCRGLRWGLVLSVSFSSHF